MAMRMHVEERREEGKEGLEEEISGVSAKGVERSGLGGSGGVLWR